MIEFADKVTVPAERKRPRPLFIRRGGAVLGNDSVTLSANSSVYLQAGTAALQQAAGFRRCSILDSMSDSKKRCGWANGDPSYEKYHDEEWGVPVHDDRKHFEFLILEGAQAGLSWLTILKRREGYRAAFVNFDPQKVAQFDETDVMRLLQDPGIIRNKLKIRAAIKNAQVFLNIQKEFGSFDAYIWGFVSGKSVINKPKTLNDIPAKTELSDRVSKELKNRGMSFVGSTIIYAYLQAVGLVNDHVCSKRNS